MTNSPEPPQFPFRRSGRVVHSARGLYVFATGISVVVVLLGTLPLLYPGRNSTANIVILYGFLAVLLAMAGWCAYWGRRVRVFEREYQRATGREYDGSV